MTYFLIWLAYAATQIAAAMSPGPAFVLTVRNSITYGRANGIYSAIGLGCGVAVHIGLVLLGLATVMAKSVWLYNLIKYIGAAYLIYIGVKALRAQPRVTGEHSNDDNPSPKAALSAPAAVQQGFLTNLLNPKALVLSTSIVPQFIHPETPSSMLLIFWLTSITVEVTWFSLVSLVLNYRQIKSRFLSIAHWIDRICGGLMVGLGIRLAISKL